MLKSNKLALFIGKNKNSQGLVAGVGTWVMGRSSLVVTVGGD